MSRSTLTPSAILCFFAGSHRTVRGLIPRKVSNPLTSVLIVPGGLRDRETSLSKHGFVSGSVRGCSWKRLVAVVRKVPVWKPQGRIAVRRSQVPCFFHLTLRESGLLLDSQVDPEVCPDRW